MKMPALVVTVSVKDDRREPLHMPLGTVLFVRSIPSQLNPQNIYMAKMSASNTFKIPETIVSLLVNAADECPLISPSMCMRLSATGHSVMSTNGEKNSGPGMYQHMVTIMIPYNDLLQGLLVNTHFLMHQHTEEDGQEYVISAYLDSNSAMNQKQLRDSMTILNDHVQNICDMHGQNTMSVAEAIEVANNGRMERSKKMQEAYKMLYPEGQLAEWFLTENRLFKMMKVDMAQADYMRTVAVKGNPDLQFMFFVLICGGMLSEITQRYNGSLGSLDSVINALNSWTQEGRTAMLDEFTKHLQRHNASVSGYLPDPGWWGVNGRLELKQEPGEDQNFCGAPQVEALLNKIVHAAVAASSDARGPERPAFWSCWLGDCEDLTGFMLAILDILKLDRKDFISSMHKSINNMPLYFKNQPAVSDYTTVKTPLMKIAVHIWEACQPDQNFTPATPVQNMAEIIRLIQANSNKEPACGKTYMASILARAQTIDQNPTITHETESRVSSVEDFSRAWMNALSGPGPSIYSGHCIGMTMDVRPLASMSNGVDISMIANTPGLVEGTAYATAVSGPDLKVSAQYGNGSDKRMKVTAALTFPIQQTMAVNIESTLLMDDMQKNMDDNSGPPVTVTSKQIYNVGGDQHSQSFYHAAISAGPGALLSIGLESGCIVPGVPLCADFEKVQHVMMHAPMGKPEKAALTLLGSVAGQMGLTVETMAKNDMLPLLNPLSARMVLSFPSHLQACELQPVTSVVLQTLQRNNMHGLNTGVCIKTPVQRAPDVEGFARRVGDAMKQVFPANSQMQLGAFTGTVIVESRS